MCDFVTNLPGLQARFGNHGSKSASEGQFVSKQPNGLQLEGLAEMSLLDNNRQTSTPMELRISPCTDMGGDGQSKCTQTVCLCCILVNNGRH